MAYVKILPVDVFRYPGGDFTDGGISLKYDELFLVCDKGWFEVDENDKRIIVLDPITVGGKEHLRVKPKKSKPKDGFVGPMFGGNFVYSCDSRFPGDYPIPILDRYETYNEYKILSE